ncbi:MAG: DUF3160 domain-containing protein [Candidatus Thorarchaeota archaeon]
MSCCTSSGFAFNLEYSSTQPNYYDLVKLSFNLTPAEKKLLTSNNFIVLNRMGTDDILDAYKYYWKEDLPIFITTDTMLHTWHLIFDTTLENLEEVIFYPLLSKLSTNLISNALAKYNGNLISRDTLIYLVVASELGNSNNNENLPIAIKTASEKIVNAILEEISLDSAINYLNTDSTRRFIDDFSQYKPRGHYTHSENLKMYFRLFKWFSRIPFFFDDYYGYVYLRTEPRKLIRSSLEVTWLLKETTIECFEKKNTGLEIWEIFKTFLDVIVGQTNSISPRALNDICKNLKGDSWSLVDIDNSLISQVQEIVLNDSAIQKPKIPFIIDAYACGLSSPKTFVLFGERLTIDSYALNHFVYPYVGNTPHPQFRLIPTSLDFAAACLDSQRSFELLTPEFDKWSYEPKLLDSILNVQEEIHNIKEEEKQTVHWQWTESLKDIAVTEPEFSEGISIPKFMISSAWLDEKLTTIMGSWTQLKHDTILYSKQSLTSGMICSTPTGYVEPYPEFYKKLRELCILYKSAINSLESIGFDFEEYYILNDNVFRILNYIEALNNFGNATEMLEAISIKELTGIGLDQEEKQFINSTYGESGTCGGPFIYGWLVNIIGRIDGKYATLDVSPNSRASLVADIHTDTNTGDILHLATGLLEPIIAIVPGWDNEEIAVVGPVFSFYEFVLPSYQRLNDEEWRGIMALWIDGNRQNYDFSIFPRGFWAESYMVSTEMTINRIFIDDEDYGDPKWFTGEGEFDFERIMSLFSIICPISIVLCIGLLIRKYRKFDDIFV